MFCRQCEQTLGTQACTKNGVCGKDNTTAFLQDVLVQSLIVISLYGNELRKIGIKDPVIDRFIIESLFVTVTNVNFDQDSVISFIKKASAYIDNLKTIALEKDIDVSSSPIAEWKPADTVDELLSQGENVVFMDNPDVNIDIQSLREILLSGLKGMAAYADHAAILQKEDDEVNTFFYKGLAAIVNDALTVDDYVNIIMEFGKVNLACMKLLDQAHTEAYGHPVPTPVSLGMKKGSAILISGHDLKDLAMLLEQTQGTGVNVYTHGEMLPAHGYPEFSKYDHFVGHYGGAWQNQQKEFADFAGVILMTTNCIQKPLDAYSERIFTTGLVCWPNVVHIGEENGKKDFSKLIEQAKLLGGYEADTVAKEILVGFAHNAVMNVADKVIEGVKSGKIRHFFLIGGCDGAKPGRNYFTEFAQKVPKDCVILTLACGKFRFNTLDFGDIDGIPRLLDCGQCNDAYSAIAIASALAEAFDCSVNDLPLSLILSWYEQKAVCILLTLLSLGIKNIKLGPTLPAFISENVLNVLVQTFNLQPITTVDDDLKSII